jgi:hypothetical protein
VSRYLRVVVKTKVLAITITTIARGLLGASATQPRRNSARLQRGRSGER